MDDAKKKAGPPQSLSRAQERANKLNTHKKRRQADRQANRKALDERIKSMHFTDFLVLDEDAGDAQKLQALVNQIVIMVKKDPEMGIVRNKRPQKPQPQPEEKQQPEQKPDTPLPSLNRMQEIPDAPVREGLLGSVADSVLDNVGSLIGAQKHAGQARQLTQGLGTGFKKAAAGLINRKHDQQTTTVSQAAQIAYAIRALVKNLGKPGMDALTAMLNNLAKTDKNVAERTRNFIIGV